MKKTSNLQIIQEPELDIALAEPVALSFPIIQKAHSVTSSLVGLWNFQASVDSLTFCFSFSFKHFVYFAVFECFSSFDVLMAPSIPKPGPAQGQATSVSIIPMQMKSLHSAALLRKALH